MVGDKNTRNVLFWRHMKKPQAPNENFFFGLICQILIPKLPKKISLSLHLSLSSRLSASRSLLNSSLPHEDTLQSGALSPPHEVTLQSGAS